MVINTYSSFRRYTPPTCTLEIYHPQSFWGNFGPKPFPEHFSFQLSFDDPRLPKDDKSIIIGDRNLLEKLRNKVEEYLNNYLKSTKIVEEFLACELPLNNQEDFICVTRESNYRHRLYYRCFFPKEETLEVILTNTQLLDFINALSAYYADATKKTSTEKQESISSHLGLSITITALVCLIGGSMWWRYERQIATNIVDNTEESNQEMIKPNIESVIPPSSLDPKTLPPMVTPEVPEDLKNKESLLLPASATPPQLSSEMKISNNNNMVSNNLKENQRVETIILPPPPSPTTENNLSLEKMPEDNYQPNMIAIKPSLPVATSSFQAKQPLANPSNPPYPSRLSSLPVLESSNLDKVKNPLPIPSKNLPYLHQPGINTFNGVSPSVMENIPKFEQQISKLDSSLNQKKSTEIISREVKQYFKNKWQPPENLKHSIEYRLNFNQNGSLTKITPIGQVAVIFLDRTGIPLLGEKVTSSFSDADQAVVRLILSPNGNIQTFPESK